MSENLLVVENVEKQYPAPDRPLRVLDGVSFTLDAGASLSIMGPSGSGKSTLLNIIGTLDTPTGGRVLFAGEDVSAFSAARSAAFRGAEIGFVFQEHHLLPQCTALENVLVPVLAAGSAGAEKVERARMLLALVGVGDRGRHFPGELSGGERQRVAIARAMVNRPRLLLCDEATGNLDAAASDAVGDLLLRLRDDEKVALLVVTHNEAFARRFGRRARLEGGKLHEPA